MTHIAAKMRRKNRLLIRMQGPLFKQGANVKSWKLRYFVVACDHVFYFDSKSDFEKFESLAGDDVENLPSSIAKIALGTLTLRCDV